jgi:8-oxo-dGTP pyrophosphatase MutT (NUDIX family)
MKHATDIPEFGIARENEERRDGGNGIVYDPKTQKYAVGKQKNGLYRLFSGGVDGGEDVIEGTKREVIEESGLYDFKHVEKLAEAITHYYNSLRKVNRVAHAICLLLILQSTKKKSVKLEEHEEFSLEWVSAEELMKNWEERNEEHDYDHWIYFLKKAVIRLREIEYETGALK